jgi:signal peptidase I
MEVSKGDKILAIKCIYQFVEPKRWDVVIFKNPVDPSLTYIKRMIGLPKESVEIIDGDVYINKKIARKPPKVQEEIWMPIYENDYQPIKPLNGVFNGHYWKQPFDTANSKWETSKKNNTEFVLNYPFGNVNELNYDSSIGNDFRATYAYNDVRYYGYHPYCSDLMIRFCVQSEGETGKIGILLSKYETSYKAWVSSTGEMVIARVKNNKQTILKRKEIDKGFTNDKTKVEFANVDHELVFSFGSEKLTHDLGPFSKDAGERKPQIEPQVQIFGSGNLTISHVGVFRDIHYTSSMFGNGAKNGTAIEGNPITLGEDEFFVLGDNSPASADGRWWNQKGKGNSKSYRKGIVPRDYLIGKAMVVFWPGGYKPFEKFPFHCIPDFGRLKIIYGGSEENPKKQHLNFSLLR